MGIQMRGIFGPRFSTIISFAIKYFNLNYRPPLFLWNNKVGGLSWPTPTSLQWHLGGGDIEDALQI